MQLWPQLKSLLRAAALCGLAVNSQTSSLTQAQTVATGSGLPVPRFVSLKSDRVNVRKGPGTDYPVAWVFERAGLPVEIVKEFENWRQVRDSEGAEGWVLANLVSGRRTALVAPWETKATVSLSISQPTPLHTSAADGSGITALLGTGVLINVQSCDGNWCQVSANDQQGFIVQARLWGVYKGEALR